MAKISPSTWHRIMAGARAEVRVYASLAKVFKLEPTSLVILDWEPLRSRDARQKFMHVVERMIYEGLIPPFKKDGETPIDIVRYVWQLENGPLDDIAISYHDQRNAFARLAAAGLLISRPALSFDGKPDAIGPMHISEITLKDIEVDIAKRRQMASRLVSDLEIDYRENGGIVYQRVKTTFLQRVDAYLRTEHQDIEANAVGLHNVEELMDADLHCRMTFVGNRTNDSRDFERNYYHSRRLVRLYVTFFPTEIPKYWPVFRNANTSDLKAMQVAIDDPVPNFRLLRKAILHNIDNTWVGIQWLHKRLYPNSIDETPPCNMASSLPDGS